MGELSVKREFLGGQMRSHSLWHSAIIFASLVGLILTGSLIFKTHTKKSRLRPQTMVSVPLDPSKVDQIKIVKPLKDQKVSRAKKYGYRGRRVSSSSYTTANLNDLFGPFGPLKGLSARERFQFKKQVVGYVDRKIRRGSIDPRHRKRYIEMKVLDKSLEMLEATASN